MDFVHKIYKMDEGSKCRILPRPYYSGLVVDSRRFLGLALSSFMPRKPQNFSRTFGTVRYQQCLEQGQERGVGHYLGEGLFLILPVHEQHAIDDDD